LTTSFPKNRPVLKELPSCFLKEERQDGRGPLFYSGKIDIHLTYRKIYFLQVKYIRS